MARQAWTMGQAQRQADQGWRAGNAIEQLQGPAYGFGALTMALVRPLNPSNVPSELEAAGIPLQQNVEIKWIAQTFNSAAGESIISARPNRVILIVQNLSPTNPAAVNFDQEAAVTGVTPNFTSQGLLLLPGVSLFIDKWCHTGTIHISSVPNAVPVVAVQGTSGIGNVPFIET